MSNALTFAQLLQNVEDYAVGAVKALNREIGRETDARMPVDTREAQASRRVTLNEPSTETSVEQPTYPTRGEAEDDAALRDFELGDTVHHVWIADHPSILEGGRRPDRNGRMIGSEQASEPGGVVAAGRDAAIEKMRRYRGGGT